jgi:Tol biopolymer transport system component
MRVFRKRIPLGAAAAFLLLCFAVTARSQSMPGYQAPTKPKDQTPSSLKAARGEAPLAKLYGHLRPDASRVKRLPLLDPNSIPKQERPLEKILNIGVVRALASDLNPMTDSAMYPVVEGYVRVAAVTSPGAVAMRLHFQDFSIPAGARVFVYSSANSDVYFGPYEGKGPWGDGVFWTPPVRGDQVIIEYQEPVGVGSHGVPFKVNEVSHVYKDVFSTDDPAGVCNLEVPAEWANVAKSVGLLDFMTDQGEAVCTGTLLNDADTTQDHHVLTANHCIDAEFEAQSLTIYWNYNTGDTPPGGTPTTNGAHVLTTSNGLDFTLLHLTGALPGGLFFSGWDASAVSTGTSVTGIHHPQGSHKRASFGATNPDCDSQLPSSCSNFTGVTWSQGTTEEGSSGSGIWTGTPENAKLVGTLLGGFAACNNPSGTDFYSRFSVVYQSIAQFLEPLRTLTVTSVNPSTVGIIVLLNGNNQPSGSTPFTRTFFHNSSVTLTASSTLVNGNTFQKWQRDGVDFTTSASTTVTMDANHTMTAVYLSPPTVVLTLASSNPSSGVNIAVTPNDNNGLGNGTTQFTRTYNQNSSVNLTAPASVAGNIFWKWQVDGVDFTTSPSTSVAMGATARTATAIYFTPGPTPTPTPVPGAGLQPIAFVKAGTNSPGSDLYLTNVDGTSVVNLTDVQGDDTLPAWSPDGSRLAYTCLRQPDGSISLPRRICVRNADGTGFVVLSNTAADDYGPAWSRDGSLIAFTTSSSGSQTMLGLMNADGTGRVTLLPGASNPDLSPDNSTLLFQSGISLWTYNRLTQTSQQLTFGTIDSRPRYSPDGSKIVFERISDSAFQIYVMNSDGTGQTRLSKNEGWDAAPAWSPDGTKILFTGLRIGESALYVMNVDASNVTRVTAGSDGVWRPVPTTPVIFTEAGSNNVVAVNSVTLLRGPFQILDPHNFSTDGHTRVILFTSNLAMFSPPIPSTSTLSVQANGVNLPIEKVGMVTGVTGMSSSYIVVRLPDGLPTGNLSLTVTARGITSAAVTLPIGP